MTTELTMLAWSVTLLIVLIVIQGLAGIRAQGLAPLAGARDNLPPPGVFQARALRVVDNHREGLTVVAPLILIAAAAHISTPWTVLGAQLFFWSRLGHAITYLLGAPWVRTAIFAVGLAGAAMILAAVLGLR